MNLLKKKKKLKVKKIKALPELEVVIIDDNARFLIGWPGYRTANNKSGLGYVETQAEWAHMQGVMIRWMIRGKFKTRNPVYLFFILVYGVFNASPILLLFAGNEGRFALIRNLHIFLIPILIGVLLLLNVILSLIK